MSQTYLPQLFYKPCVYLFNNGSDFSLHISVLLPSDEELTPGEFVDGSNAPNIVNYYVAKAEVPKDGPWIFHEVVALQPGPLIEREGTVHFQLFDLDKAERKHRAIVHYAEADQDATGTAQ